MPYKVEKKDSGCDVVNTETNEVKEHHEDCEAAHRQVRILEAIEHDTGED